MNAWRQKRNLPIVSWSAVQGFIQRSSIIDRSKRLTKKSGKDDPNSPWAMARLEQALQLRYQLDSDNLLVGRYGNIPGLSVNK